MLRPDCALLAIQPALVGKRVHDSHVHEAAGAVISVALKPVLVWEFCQVSKRTTPASPSTTLEQGSMNVTESWQRWSTCYSCMLFEATFALLARSVLCT